MRPVTIVMYHYVRDLEHSRFPAIKGLSVERFCRQLDYIQNRYTPIAVENLLERCILQKGSAAEPYSLDFRRWLQRSLRQRVSPSGRARHPRLLLSSGAGGP